jgi:two-component system NtrC family sensor kinase
VNRWSTLRIRLLFELGFVTSSAVLVVGMTTVLVSGADPADVVTPLILLWLGATAVFVFFGWYLVHRLVLQPLRQLAAEADSLATSKLSGPAPVYETAELTELAQRYRAMAEDLLDVQSHVVRVEKLAGIGRLAAGVAHEVRNPLGALGTYVEVLQRRGTDPAVTDDMRCAIERIERIVQGLMDYARPGNLAADGSATALTDLNASVRRVMEFLAAQGAFRDRAVETRLAADLPRVRGDEHLLEQVVVNLVVNACQAAPGGRVSVATVAKRFDTRETAHATESRRRRRVLPDGIPGVLLYVADDGPGVPEPDRERIFDPFYTTKDPGEGTGLGLAIVARTVHESGGVVWVDRSREGGAVFMVFLPIASETDAAVDR